MKTILTSSYLSRDEERGQAILPYLENTKALIVTQQVARGAMVGRAVLIDTEPS